MKIYCSNCNFEFTVEVKKRPLEDFIEIGLECPQCHHWYHSYYTNKELEKYNRVLGRFMDKARLSKKNWDRYQIEKGKFQARHDNLQIQAGKYIAENY